MGVSDRISDGLVALAARMLPPDRADWAFAMRAEYGAALVGGRAMPFALGCLIAALRAHLVRPSERFAVGRSVIVLATVVPLATFHLGCALGSFRFALGAPDHYHAALLAGAEAQRRIASAYAAAAPVFGLLLLVLGASHLVAAWNLIEWRLRPLMAAMGVALLASVALAFTIVSVMGDWTGVAVQFAGFGIEAALLAAFAAWARHALPRRWA